MLRNFIVAGLVAAIMGGFVLTFQAIAPPRPAMDRDEEPLAMRDREARDRMAEADQQPPMNGRQAAPTAPMQPQQPGAAVRQPQPGPMMGQAQPPGMQMMAGGQPMPMMGMCPPMMMMMGGGNMGGGMNQQPGMSQPSAGAQQSQTSGMRQEDLQKELEAEFQQLQKELRELKDATKK